MTKRKRRGSSKAGRPRKEGARYPSGKLKPAGPNERVLDKRRAGDAEAGEHPLDFALSKHWITEQMHRDATAYRVAFNRSHIGATAPRLGLASLPEVEPSEALRMKWGEMPDGEIAGIWDAVFGEDAVANAAVMEEGALAAWRLLNSSLSPAEREELFKVSILGQPPRPAGSGQDGSLVRRPVWRRPLPSSAEGCAGADFRGSSPA